MKNISKTLATHTTTDLSRAVADLIRDRIGHGIDALNGLWHSTVRRRDPLFHRRPACYMDLGADGTLLYPVTLLNLSTGGCLLRVPAGSEPAEHLHEIGEIRLDLDDGVSLRLYGTLVRAEPDTLHRDGTCMRVSFAFTALDRNARGRLSRYIDRCAPQPRVHGNLVGDAV